MGKRSRKRTGAAGSATATPAEPRSSGGATTRAERDAARARRAKAARTAAEAPATKSDSWSERRRKAGRPTIDDRPPAPWGSFPLVELMVFAALVMLVIGGLFAEGTTQQRLVFAALAIGSLAGLELSIREHFAGYRSHSTVLAGVVAFACAMVVAVVAGKINLLVLAIVGLSCFGVALYLFREAFKRRSGGLGFR